MYPSLSPRFLAGVLRSMEPGADVGKFWGKTNECLNVGMVCYILKILQVLLLLEVKREFY